MADKQKIVYWSKKLLKTSSSSSSLDLSRSGNDWIRCSSSAKERFTTDTKLKTVSVRSANVANHVPCKHVFVCVSLLKDCFSFVFKWTVNEFDVSVETLAIRESTLASIPCQGLTLNWRAAVKKKKTHTLKRTSPICTGPRGPDHMVPSEWIMRRLEGGGAKRCSRRSLTCSEWRALRSRR